MNWSMPKNWMLGFAFAAASVSVPMRNPTVTMMSYFWSTKLWMFCL